LQGSNKYSEDFEDISSELSTCGFWKIIKFSIATRRDDNHQINRQIYYWPFLILNMISRNKRGHMMIAAVMLCVKRMKKKKKKKKNA
jgi:hypothetical protein